MKREEVLEAARKCVCGDREKSYGSPERSFECIAELWTAYLKQRGVTAAITPWDVAWMMVLLKASRAAGNTSYIDGCIDAAGYAACGAECAAAMSGCERVGGVDYGTVPNLKAEDIPSTGNPFGHGIQPKTM